MATMNRPTYAAIQTHSSNKPVLVFVSSRRQTRYGARFLSILHHSFKCIVYLKQINNRLTALDLITFAAANETPRQFLHISEAELESYLASVLISFNNKHFFFFF
jgi:activating signal cointegrator complex subunit 3